MYIYIYTIYICTIYKYMHYIIIYTYLYIYMTVQAWLMYWLPFEALLLQIVHVPQDVAAENQRFS